MSTVEIVEAIVEESDEVTPKVMVDCTLFNVTLFSLALLTDALLSVPLFTEVCGLKCPAVIDDVDVVRLGVGST